MMPIRTELVDTFADGRRRVMRAVEPGTVKVPTKAGLVDAPYNAGDALLVDADDLTICGPVSLAGATDLADRILDGDQRAVTDPQALNVLATALVAFQITLPAPNEPEPVALEMAVTHA
jgi:hypothetical protein